MDAHQKALEFFETANEPVNAGKVAEATGIDRKEVDKVSKRQGRTEFLSLESRAGLRIECPPVDDRVLFLCPGDDPLGTLYESRSCQY